MQNRFIRLLQKYTTDETYLHELWLHLHHCYTEKHRTYHNLTHLEELFHYFDRYSNELSQPNIVSFSIFYHDIVYKIWNTNNEEKSAEMALNKLQKLNLSPFFLEGIKSQILTTKTHKATSNDTQFLIDFDLAILGQSGEEYQKYAKNIRKEYEKVPSFLYKKGRKKVLQHFLTKKTIYQTEIFRNKYEIQARTNLENELKTEFYGF